MLRKINLKLNKAKACSPSYIRHDLADDLHFKKINFLELLF